MKDPGRVDLKDKGRKNKEKGTRLNIAVEDLVVEDSVAEDLNRADIEDRNKEDAKKASY